MQLWWWGLILLFELNLFCPTLRCNSGDGSLYCCASGPDLSLFYFFYLNLFCPSLRRNSVDGILYCSLNSIWFVPHLDATLLMGFYAAFWTQFGFYTAFWTQYGCPTHRCNSGDGISCCFLNSICFVLHLDATLVMGFYAAFWTQFVLSHTLMQIWWWNCFLTSWCNSDVVVVLFPFDIL